MSTNQPIMFKLINLIITEYLTIFNPGNSDSKESACNAGDLDSIPELRRSPGGGHGNPLQYSCLGNPMDRGAWRAAVHGVTKESDTTGQISTAHSTQHMESKKKRY